MYNVPLIITFSDSGKIIDVTTNEMMFFATSWAIYFGSYDFLYHASELVNGLIDFQLFISSRKRIIGKGGSISNHSIIVFNINKAIGADTWNTHVELTEQASTIIQKLGNIGIR